MWAARYEALIAGSLANNIRALQRIRAHELQRSKGYLKNDRDNLRSAFGIVSLVSETLAFAKMSTGKDVFPPYVNRFLFAGSMTASIGLDDLTCFVRTLATEALKNLPVHEFLTKKLKLPQWAVTGLVATGMATWQTYIHNRTTGGYRLGSEFWPTSLVMSISRLEGGLWMNLLRWPFPGPWAYSIIWGARCIGELILFSELTPLGAPTYLSNAVAAITGSVNIGRMIDMRRQFRGRLEGVNCELCRKFCMEPVWCMGHMYCCRCLMRYCAQNGGLDPVHHVRIDGHWFRCPATEIALSNCATIIVREQRLRNIRQ